MSAGSNDLRTDREYAVKLAYVSRNSSLTLAEMRSLAPDELDMFVGALLSVVNDENCDDEEIDDGTNGGGGPSDVQTVLFRPTETRDDN